MLEEFFDKLAKIFGPKLWNIKLEPTPLLNEELNRLMLVYAVKVYLPPKAFSNPSNKPRWKFVTTSFSLADKGNLFATEDEAYEAAMKAVCLELKKSNQTYAEYLEGCWKV